MCETGRLVLYPGELAYMPLGHNLSTLTLSDWVTLWVALTFIQCYEPIIGHPLMGRPRTNTTLYGDLKGDLKSYLSLNWGKWARFRSWLALQEKTSGIVHRISLNFKLFTFPEDCGLTSLVMVKIIHGRLSRLCNLMYHCVNSCKVLFSYQVSWVIIMASQVYYGFMLFNMIVL